MVCYTYAEGDRYIKMAAMSAASFKIYNPALQFIVYSPSLSSELIDMSNKFGFETRTVNKFDELVLNVRKRKRCSQFARRIIKFTLDLPEDEYYMWVDCDTLCLKKIEVNKIVCKDNGWGAAVDIQGREVNAFDVLRWLKQYSNFPKNSSCYFEKKELKEFMKRNALINSGVLIWHKNSRFLDNIRRMIKDDLKFNIIFREGFYDQKYVVGYQMMDENKEFSFLSRNFNEMGDVDDNTFIHHLAWNTKPLEEMIVIFGRILEKMRHKA